jgi:hypothetical protein
LPRRLVFTEIYGTERDDVKDLVLSIFSSKNAYSKVYGIVPER